MISNLSTHYDSFQQTVPSYCDAVQGQNASFAVAASRSSRAYAAPVYIPLSIRTRPTLAAAPTRAMIRIWAA
jgi:hypothetical protein